MAVKRLLSIDGGGIRGVIAASILVEIEQALYKHNPKYKRLSDFFHFIGGTSTGSILAAGLAKGMSASELLAIYKDKGKSIFTKSRWAQFPILGDLFTKYNPKPLEHELKVKFGDLTIGSHEIKTKLVIITKNITSGSPYIFSNLKTNPLFIKDPNVKIQDIIRGSSAAPTFFPPHTFSVGDRDYEFIDGGVSMYNNPALEIFLQATQPKYKLNWLTGAKNLLLVSIGNGFFKNPINYKKAANFTAIQWAKYVTNTLIDDANRQQNQILKIIGHQPNQWDRKQKKVIYNKKLSEKELEGKLFTYFRFTTLFDRKQLEDRGISSETQLDISKIKKIDCVSEVYLLEKIGKAIAKEQFSIDRFDGFLKDDTQ